MAATHENIITINIMLDPPPMPGVGFSPALAGDFTLDGDRVRTYNDPDDIDADESAGYLSSFAATALKNGLAQQPSPGVVKAISVDASGSEDYDEAISAAVQEDGSIYAVAIDSRSAADQILVSTWAEQRDHLFVMQTDDADVLASGFPSAYASIENNENTLALYHDEDNRAEDFAWISNRLAFDPDFQSAPWDAPLAPSLGYTAPISTTEQGNAEDNNFNLLLPLGPSDTYVANKGVGVNLAGRQIAEIFTKHWFKRRLQEAVAAEKVKYSARGEKIPVSIQGTAIVQSLVEALFDKGEAAGHFIPGQTIAEFPIPDQSDIENNRIRGGGRAQLATSAGIFVFDFIFTREPVVEVD